MDNRKWTTEKIPDLTGKVIIVTGGNSGLGFETVKAFAGKGAEIIMACRTTEKGEFAKSEILKYSPNAKIVVMPLDLADLESIKKFSANVKQKYNRLDVLVNNAGIMTTPYFLTQDGLEAQMGTNHFGHFALTGRLLELLKNTPKSRVVNLSSSAHKAGKMDFENLLFENGRGYTPLKSYGRSKLANLLFTYELQRFFAKNKTDCLAVAAHPGVAKTNLTHYIQEKFWFRFLQPLFTLVSQSGEMGALPQIRASVDPLVKSGEFYGPDKGTKGYPVVVKSNEASYNAEDAKKLWAFSEQITGVKFE